MKRLLSLTLLLCACASTPAPTESDALRQIADAYWQHQLEEDVNVQTRLGIATKHLPDASYAQAQHDATFGESILRRLNAIDASRFDAEDRISYSLLRWYAQKPIDNLRFFWLRSPVTPYTFQFAGVNDVFKMQHLDSAERARLLAEYGRYIDQISDVVREQERRGYVLPKPELPLVRGMITSFMQPPEKSALRGGDDSPGVRDAIATIVNPSLQRLLDIFNADYEAHAPNDVGLSQYPGGLDAYLHLIHVETSYDQTPEEIHQLGLKEIDRINGELDAVRKQTGFTGTLAEFRQFLKTDPRFFAKTPDEIGARRTDDLRKIEPQIPRFFAKLPRAPYDVRRLDPSLEASMTFGYYQVPTAMDAVGHYMYNGSKPNERNLLFAPALMLHELVPGHHFQLARQAENTSLPPFRRETHDTAYTEGWGEYSAALGNEMGIYADPYDHAGRLMMDALLSARLVVDTGMNALGWSREKAMQYLRENTLLSDTEIATETLRYAVDIPAQALAYKIGSMKMIELRMNAQKALGRSFDIKEFHEWIIGSGSMPLSFLEQHVNYAMMHRGHQVTVHTAPSK